MVTQEYCSPKYRWIKFVSDDGRVEIEVSQDSGWIDEQGNLRNDYREPVILVSGRMYSPYHAMQILFLLAAALETAQKWASEKEPAK